MIPQPSQQLVKRARAATKPADVFSLARELSTLKDPEVLKPLRLAVLSSYAFNVLDPVVRVAGAAEGYLVESYL